MIVAPGSPIINKNPRGMFPGYYDGNIWQTYNIDLEQYPGRIALADKFLRFSSTLGVVYKFLRTNATSTDEWFGIVNATDLLRNGNSLITSGTWVTDDTTGTFNDPLDMIIHEKSDDGNDRLLCSRDADIAMLNDAAANSDWDPDWFSTVATGGFSLQSSTFHPLARLQRLVAIGDETSTNIPVIHTLDKDDVVSRDRLVFPAQYTVRHIITTSNRFWIGLQNNFDGNCRIIEWDGFSLTYNQEHDLVGSSPLTGFVVNDIPYWITDKGFIFKYSGGGFVQVQDFNIKEERVIFSSSLTNENTITPYGSWVDGHLVYLNVGISVTQSTTDADTTTNGVRRGRSGVWIYNTRTGNLYHHAAFGEHATAGTDVNYGNGFVDNVGAVIKATIGLNRTLVASGQVFVGGATWLASSVNGIYELVESDNFASDAGRNRGYFITSYLTISEAEAMWEALWVKFRRFRITAGDTTSDDRVIVKWRTLDPLFEADAQDVNNNLNFLMNSSGTWVSTTTFTSAVPLGVAIGDEVEILTGDNAGCSFNISALSATPDNDTSITVTIDEAAPTSSTDTFLCRFDNWRSETAISSATIGDKKVPFTRSSTANSGNNQGEFIQFKVELRGHGTLLDELYPFYKIKTSKAQT